MHLEGSSDGKLEFTALNLLCTLQTWLFSCFYLCCVEPRILVNHNLSLYVLTLHIMLF